MTLIFGNFLANEWSDPFFRLKTLFRPKAEGVLECDTRLRPFVPLRIMSHKLRYTVTASFGGYFWSLMMVLVSVVSSLREGNIVSALAICVAWTHMNWAASRRLLSTPTTSCQGHCHRTRLVLQVDLDFWKILPKSDGWALKFYLQT